MKSSGWNERRRLYDRWVRYLFLSSAGLMAVLIFAIILFVGQQGLQTFHEVSPAEFFLSTRWEPTEGQYGALSFIWGTFLVTVLSVILGAPLGISCAVFLAKIAPNRLRLWMKPIINLYMAIPSVVYGFLGLTILVPWVRTTFDVPSGFGLLSASLILGVMILPTVITISEDALQSVPQALEDGSLALGATRWQTLWRVIIPAASPGIMTGVVLAMARAVGETMAVQMVIGNAPQMAKSLFMPTGALPSAIVVEMGNTPFGSVWGNSLFLMALVLLLISVGMILCIRSIGRREVA